MEGGETGAGEGCWISSLSSCGDGWGRGNKYLIVRSLPMGRRRSERALYGLNSICRYVSGICGDGEARQGS